MRDLILGLYDAGMIRIGEFKLTSGATSPVYVDLRVLPSHPEMFRLVAARLACKASEIDHDYIVGVATGGVPLASVAAYILGKPFGYVRPSRKGHGTGRTVEGKPEGRRVLIIDDVATTGSSLEAAAKAVEEAGGSPVAALVVVDRFQGARERLKKLGIGLYSLSSLPEILEALVESGRLGRDEYLVIRRRLWAG
jgi:orotate phosphoribosyltransferase